MEKLEYKTIKFKPEGFIKNEINLEEVDRELNILSSEGWQVVTSFPVDVNGHTTGVYFTLKRLKL
ncbi:DUF4177 domain-containing protein [Neobacillus sp. D3-1R]|uniref:DUF4177 domain-containing protein n=1 Tax=Neobacillus sp. D3-1R TaxID=3445778 RepID=UPI003F9FB3DD